MTPTPAQIARARALLATTPSHDNNEADENDADVPIATLRGLTPRDHFEVSEWGRALEETLRANNPKSRFSLWIRGEQIGARTNASVETIAAAIVDNIETLRKGHRAIPHTIVITFDAVITHSVTENAAK